MDDNNNVIIITKSTSPSNFPLSSPLQNQERGDCAYTHHNEYPNEVENDPLLPPSCRDTNRHGQYGQQQQSWQVRSQGNLCLSAPTSPSQPLPTHFSLHQLTSSPSLSLLQPVTQPVTQPVRMPEQSLLTNRIISSSSSSPVLSIPRPRLESGIEQNMVTERDNKTQELLACSARGMGEEKSAHRVRRPTRFDVKDDRYEHDSKRSRL